MIEGRNGSPQLVRGAQIEALGPQGILAAQNAGKDEGSGEASGDAASPHWTQNFTGQYGSDAQTRQVALTDLKGPGTEYLQNLDTIATGNVTYGKKAELLDVQYHEVTKQTGVLTKAIIAVATQGMGTWATFAVNTAVDGIISGEINLENIAKDAAFAYVSTDLGIGGTNSFPAEFGSQQWLTDTAVIAARDGAVRTAVYGGSIKDNVLNSATQIAVNDATGVLQNEIGNVKFAQQWGEGSVPGVLLHGLGGGLSSAAQGGDFAAGFVVSGGAELATRYVDDQTGGDTIKTGNTIRKWVNPSLAALTSGGDVGQYSINQGLADSQLKSNYMAHWEQPDPNGPAYATYYDYYASENCVGLSASECRSQYDRGAVDGIRIILDEVPFVGEGIAGFECWSTPEAGSCE